LKFEIIAIFVTNIEYLLNEEGVSYLVERSNLLKLVVNIEMETNGIWSKDE